MSTWVDRLHPKTLRSFPGFHWDQVAEKTLNLKPHSENEDLSKKLGSLKVFAAMEIRIPARTKQALFS